MTVDQLGSHALTSLSFVGERARVIPNAATLSGHGCPEAGRGQRLPARGPSGGLGPMPMSYGIRLISSAWSAGRVAKFLAFTLR